MNPLLIKGLCCLLGVGTVTVACVYGPGLLERKNKTVERTKGSNDKKRVEGEDDLRKEEVVDTVEQNKCSHSLDQMAKDIKSIFHSTYLEGD